MIGKTIGHYLIMSKLGAGGMGEVFLADDTRLERKAAIKFLPAEMAADPGRRKRFVNEAKAASALNHPHVCVVYDVGETADGLPFIAIKFVEGQPLDVLLRRGPLAIARVVEIAAQTADALDAAHASRIVHRDIKPGNISLNERGQVKVLDFGLATRIAHGTDLDGATQDLRQTREGQVVGTPHYMSPERALGKDLDHHTDIFSMGVVLYELTTGQMPFSRRQLCRARRQHSPRPAAGHRPAQLRRPSRTGADHAQVPPEIARPPLPVGSRADGRPEQSGQGARTRPGESRVDVVQPRGGDDAGRRTPRRSRLGAVLPGLAEVERRAPELRGDRRLPAAGRQARLGVPVAPQPGGADGAALGREGQHRPPAGGRDLAGDRRRTTAADFRG